MIDFGSLAGTGKEVAIYDLPALGLVFTTPDNVLAELANYKLLPEQFIGTHTAKVS